MSVVNEVRLIGNIGQELKLHTSESGVNVLKVSLATNEFYIGKNGERVSKTEWHNLVLFGKRAVNASKYCRKGSKVAINGKLTSRKYQGEDGIDRVIVEIIVEDIHFLDSVER